MGIGLLPPENDATYDESVAVAPALLADLRHDDASFSYLVGWTEGADIDAARQRLSAAGLSVGDPTPPARIVNMGDVSSYPKVFAGCLAALGLAGVAHALAASGRHHRGELRALHALGVTPQQMRSTVAWQAITYALVGVVDRRTPRAVARTMDVAARRHLAERRRGANRQRGTCRTRHSRRTRQHSRRLNPARGQRNTRPGTPFAASRMSRQFVRPVSFPHHHHDSPATAAPPCSLAAARQKCPPGDADRRAGVRLDVVVRSRRSAHSTVVVGLHGQPLGGPEDQLMNTVGSINVVGGAVDVPPVRCAAAGKDGGIVQLDRHRQVAAARLAPASDELTIYFADGGTTSTEIDSETAKTTVTELGLLLGETSDDGVCHWWR